MPRAKRRCANAATAFLALACNQGLEPSLAGGVCPAGYVGICGSVTIRGAVPESTEAVFVVAFAEFPQDTTDLFNLQPVPPVRLPLGDTIATYRLGLAPGRYEWVLAVWKKRGGLTTANIREAGYYVDPAQPPLPGVVVVTQGRSNVDFVVDFDNMRAVADWLTPGPAAR